MNFKDEFNKDCSKITASDELINRTLMAAMMQDDNTAADIGKGKDKSDTNDNRICNCDNITTDNAANGNATAGNATTGNTTTDNNAANGNTTAGNNTITNNTTTYKASVININSGSKYIKKKHSYIFLYRVIAAAAAIILCICAYNLILPGVRNHDSNKTDSSTLKVYAGENTEELGKNGLSMAYSKDSADHASNIQAWSEQGQHKTIMLYFDLNIQLTDSSSEIKRISVSSSDENTHLLTREPVPDEIADNDYKISDEYGEQHSLFKVSYLPDAGYRTFRLFNSKEQFLYIDHNNEYSAEYNSFEHLYISYQLSDVSSLKTRLTITAEYEDGSTVSRNYDATAYASELYMFIREVK